MTEYERASLRLLMVIAQGMSLSQMRATGPEREELALAYMQQTTKAIEAAMIALNADAEGDEADE